MNLSVCCANTTGRPVLSSINSSDFHSWEDQVYQHSILSSLMSSASTTGRPFYDAAQFRELRGNWLSCLVFPGLSDAVEGSTPGVLSLHRETKFIIGFDFAVTLSSPESFCVLFDITSEQSSRTEMANVKQTQKMIPFITCEVSLGISMSASWFLVSMYLIWIFGSKLIRSNNQSRATLWVLETCLIVGLLPFMIILITVSLSSNTYNKASWREDWTFEGIKSTLSKSLITLWDCLRLWIVWGGEQTSRWFFNKSQSCFSVLIRVSKNCNDQIP